MLAGIGDWTAVVGVIAKAVRADRHTYGAGVALWRAVRGTRALRWSSVVAGLAGNAAYRSHVAAVAAHDRLFFLAHRSYLAKGLPAKQRVRCAVAHYDYENRSFGPAFHGAVHRADGLVLWSCRADDDTAGSVTYEIRLQPGNDVLYEGGLSAVFFVDGQRTAVLSFSRIDGEAIGHRAGPRLFVTRKQLTADHGYQRAFNAAFDRTTPGHLLMAAVVGIARAHGDHALAAICPTVHPGFEQQYAERFDTAYSAFWTSLGGHKVGAFAYELPVPLAMTPLDELSGKARKRAVLRRQHLATVEDAARQVVRRVLTDAPADEATTVSPAPTIAPLVV